MEPQRRVLDIGQAVLAKNQGLADAFRAELRQRGIFMINVVSSPGSGKTELLAKTLDRLAPKLGCAVIVGDLATDHDAARLEGRGARVLQVNTDGYCHLEANMVRVAAEQIGLDDLDLLIVENVGNLVCPSSHDLGENLRVCLLSATEGEDKPLKYPVLFKSSHVAVLTKLDLAEAAEFDLEQARSNLRNVNANARMFETSAKRGDGLDAWCDFLAEQSAAHSAKVR